MTDQSTAIVSITYWSGIGSFKSLLLDTSRREYGQRTARNLHPDLIHSRFKIVLAHGLDRSTST